MVAIIAALITTFIAASVYWKTISPYLPIGDGTELITVSYIKGLAHAPGYPLLTMLGNIFLNLPINLTIPLKANILVMIFSLFAVFFFFLTFFLIQKIYFPKMQRVVMYAITTTATLILAFSYQFWLSSVQFEVFSLHNFFISILLFLTFFIHYQTINGKKVFIIRLLLAFFIGLSLTNNYTIIVFIASVLLYLYLFSNSKIDKKHFPIYLIMFACGLTPYVYIYFRIAEASQTGLLQHPVMEEFLRTIFRVDFGTFSALKDGGNYSIASIFTLMIKRTLFDIAFIGIIPFIIGLWFIIKTRYIQAFFLTALGLQLFIFFRLNLPTYSSYGTGTAERFFTNALVIVVFAIVVGLGFLGSSLKNNRHSYFFFLLFIIPLFLIFFNINQVRFQNTDAGRKLAEYILAKTGANALVMPFSDINYYTLSYLINVEQKRNDIEIFPYKLLDPQSSTQKQAFDMYLMETIKIKGVENVIIIDYPGEFIYPQTKNQYQKVPFGIIDVVKEKSYSNGEEVFKRGMELLQDFKTGFVPLTSNLPEFSTANAINALFLNQLNWHGVYLFQNGNGGLAEILYKELIPIMEELPQSNPKITAEIYKNAGTIMMRRGNKDGIGYLKKSIEIDPTQPQAETVEAVIKTYGG